MFPLATCKIQSARRLGISLCEGKVETYFKTNPSDMGKWRRCRNTMLLDDAKYENMVNGVDVYMVTAIECRTDPSIR